MCVLWHEFALAESVRTLCERIAHAWPWHLHVSTQFERAGLAKDVQLSIESLRVFERACCVMMVRM